LKFSMIRSGRWAHNNTPMAIGFNAACEFPQVGINDNLFPAAQIKGRLFLARSKL
jgi:hypothetical protein